MFFEITILSPKLGSFGIFEFGFAPASHRTAAPRVPSPVQTNPMCALTAFRVRVGDWRVGFHDHGDRIDTLPIRNRRDAYK